MLGERTTLAVLHALGGLRTTDGEWVVKSSWMTMWARMMPRLLLAARPSLGRTAYDRTYTAAELHAVSGDEDHPCWSVVRECTHHPEAWEWLCGWALEVLYPAYRARFGREHACQVRVETIYVTDRMVTARHRQNKTAATRAA